MTSLGIKAKCKHCGQDAPVESFTLDPVYRVMVCASCSRERRAKESGAQAKGKGASSLGSSGSSVQKETPTVKKPAGWDVEDEYLEKMAKVTAKPSVDVQRIDHEKVKYTCPKCRYAFIHNTVRNQPSRCPYCASDVVKFRI